MSIMSELYNCAKDVVGAVGLGIIVGLAIAGIVWNTARGVGWACRRLRDWWRWRRNPGRPIHELVAAKQAELAKELQGRINAHLIAPPRERFYSENLKMTSQGLVKCEDPIQLDAADKEIRG